MKGNGCDSPEARRHDVLGEGDVLDAIQDGVLDVPSRRRGCHSAAPPSALAGVAIGMERERQQSDRTLADGWKVPVQLRPSSPAPAPAPKQQSRCGRGLGLRSACGRSPGNWAPTFTIEYFRTGGKRHQHLPLGIFSNGRDRRRTGGLRWRPRASRCARAAGGSSRTRVSTQLQQGLSTGIAAVGRGITCGWFGMTTASAGLVAVGESSVIRLHPPRPSVGGLNSDGEGCRQNDSSADG